MFTDETVFILGAGASWHYSYPTGEELIKLVKVKAQEVARVFSDSRRLQEHLCDVPLYIKDKVPNIEQKHVLAAYSDFRVECEKLAQSLEQVNPLVIDYFLGHNSSLQDIGKLMIAWVILESEKEYLELGGNGNHKRVLRESPERAEQNRAELLNVRKCKDDWFRFILHEIMMDCESSNLLCNNKLTFVTFNYDVSIEYRLISSLKRIDLIEKADRERFLTNERVLHVYGRVQKEPYEDNLFGKLQKLENKHDYSYIWHSMDIAWEAAKELCTIPEAKKANKEVIEKASIAIDEAKYVYILGYGFDETNSELLGLNKSLKNDINAKKIFFTNYKNSNRINKRAGKIFFNDPAAFIDQSLVSRNTSFGDELKNNRYEKSINNVYGALELDFD